MQLPSFLLRGSRYISHTEVDVSSAEAQTSWESIEGACDRQQGMCCRSRRMKMKSAGTDSCLRHRALVALSQAGNDLFYLLKRGPLRRVEAKTDQVRQAGN